MVSPFIIPPHPLAQAAAREVIAKVHAYMDAHPESELHRQGKMFGVLVVENGDSNSEKNYLAAFSAKLDGTYYHEGFVPPVLEIPTPPVGTSREESKRLQQLLFADYRFTNLHGETKNLLDIFAKEKPILSPEEFFHQSPSTIHHSPLPPSGAGECCAPKLLQYALTHGMKPFALAEFWVGAAPKTEIRQEGAFYPPCSGRCKPILRWMIGEDKGEQLKGKGEGIKIDILYEDEWLMVVNKPAGLLSVPGKDEEPSVESCLSGERRVGSGELPFVKAVHRLDQDTSGLLVIAKTPEVYKTLQAYFQRRDILKRYEAVVKPPVSGASMPDEGVIDLPLLPNPYDRPRQMVDREHGKPAITRFRIRERREDGTVFVDFFPLTGRTHQLRVHAAHPDGLNAPIVGDRLYGTPAERLLLHAAEIRFVHPVTHKEMHFCTQKQLFK